jgi:hypothetical protein
MAMLPLHWRFSFALRSAMTLNSYSAGESSAILKTGTAVLWTTSTTFPSFFRSKLAEKPEVIARCYAVELAKYHLRSIVWILCNCVSVQSCR